MCAMLTYLSVNDIDVCLCSQETSLLSEKIKQFYHSFVNKWSENRHYQRNVEFPSAKTSVEIL